MKQKLLEELTTDFMNNSQFTPHVIPDISDWFPDNNFDVRFPHEHRTWIWVSQKMHFIKAGMSSLLANFATSGDNENDMDDHGRDLLFYQNFCHHQALWFWIYMCALVHQHVLLFMSFQTCCLYLFSSLRRCWDHGRNVPAYNTCLLPEDQRMEVGTDEKDDEDSYNRNTPVAAATPTSKKRKTSSTVAAVASDKEDALTSLIQVTLCHLSNTRIIVISVYQVSHHLMTSQQQMLASQASSCSSSSTNTPEKRSSALKELLDQAKLIRDAMTVMSEEYQADLKEALAGVSRDYISCLKEPVRVQDITD